MTIEEKKTAIVNALYEHLDLQNIINTAASVIENPIFVNDAREVEQAKIAIVTGRKIKSKSVVMKYDELLAYAVFEGGAY